MKFLIIIISIIFFNIFLIFNNFLSFNSFLIFPKAFSAQKKTLPATPYMDQVVKRKKVLIAEKCLKYRGADTGFMMVELKVSREGKTRARLVTTELKNKAFLSCVLSVLDRIQFKKFTERAVTRIYRFFVLS